MSSRLSYKLRLLSLCLLAIARVSPSWGGTRVTDELEHRISTYLEAYFAPEDYMVIVTQAGASAKPVSGNPVEPKAESKEVSLPGVPGFMVDAKSGGSYKAYVDMDGQFHQSESARPPVSITIVLNRSTNAEKTNLIRRVVPMIAHLDPNLGDTFTLSTSNLDKAPVKPLTPPVAPEKTFIESLVQYQKELTSIGIGLFGALAVLFLIHGTFSVFSSKAAGTRSQENPAGGQRNGPRTRGSDRANSPTTPQTGGEAAALAAAPAPQGERRQAPIEKFGLLGSGSLNRNQLYSKDSLIYEFTKELSWEGKEHPKRIAKLFTQWVQEGEVGSRKAALLLSNFDVQTRAGILAHIVPSDLDHIQAHLSFDFDPFSDENVRNILEARQDLMKITAQETRPGNRAHLEFLNQIEDEILFEILREESIPTLALISTQVPAHRIARRVVAMSEFEEALFFESLCKLDRVEAATWADISIRLKRKISECEQGSVTEASKTETLSHILRHLQSSSRQEKILNLMSAISPTVTHNVRSNLCLFDDVLALPERLLRLVLLEVDAIVIAQAFGAEDGTIRHKVHAALPKASAEIFAFEIQQAGNLTPERVNAAQQLVVETLDKLVQAKVIRAGEIKVSKKAA